MTTNLHPNVREQLRDDACYLHAFHDEAKWWPIADRIVGLLAELEWAERERDEALAGIARCDEEAFAELRRARDEALASVNRIIRESGAVVSRQAARLAKADKLAEALRHICEIAEVARTDATGDIYEIDEDAFARAKEALADWESE